MCSIPPPLAPHMSARGQGTLQGTLPDGAPLYCQEEDGCPTYPIIEIPPIVEINPDAIKLPPPMQDEDQEAFSQFFSISDKATAFHAEPTTYNKDDDILSLIKAQPSTLVIPSISITLTKPGDPWSTSSDSGEGTAFPWFTDWTATSLVTTTTARKTSAAKETSTARTTTAQETTITEGPMSTSALSVNQSSTIPEETTSPVPSKKKRASGGQIAAIVIGLVGGIGLLLLAFFAAVKFRHKLTRRRKPETVYTTMNRASAVPGRRASPSYFDTASTPDVSRNLLSAMPNVFGRWRNNSPPEYSRPEVQSPEQSMYQAHTAGAPTESSSVYSQNSHLDRPPAIPRPYGNYI
ncbi:hypothetical protein FHETE_4454 [Fusarium heterosporum]|uniref:Mid2 domain-containing protein n=1 Tax=Fusarium heterosporum TaxID=42747 RepID=A0A8H5WPH2_FUSHE|nr:hypothetical protein FHETE_4454 [Fusarium heterosporum]